MSGYMGYVRTALLLAGITALFLVVGYLIGGTGGVLIAFALAAGMNAFAYWKSDSVVLSMYHAKEVDRRSAPGLYGIVEQLVQNAELPMPRVYIVENDQPNAFATGRNPEHAAICATTGLLRRCTDEEVAGVLGHELAHVRNHDTLIQTVTATFAGAIGMLANFALFFGFFGFGSNRNNPLGLVGTLLIAILAPIAAVLVQMAISRTREYEADRIGAQISGHPLWLASALQRIEESARQIQNREAETHPATAHMFIINPLSGRGMASLFSTHPSTEDRIRRLREMAGTLSPWEA